MTDYNGYGAATTTGQGAGAGGGLTWQNDSGAYTFGQTFTVDTEGLSVTGARWYLPDGTTDAPTSGYEIGLWAVGDTTPLATAGPFTAVVGQWNEASFDSPVPIDEAPAEYRVGVLFPGGYYAAQTPGAVPWNPDGPISFPSTGTFNSGGTLTYPASSSGSAPVYGIDVTVSDGEATGNDGSGTPASAATTASGTGGITNDGSGTPASAATTASGTGGLASITGSGTASSRATTATGQGTGPVAGFAGDRDELVQLLGGISGVTALPYPAGIPAQGQAWPVLGPLDLTGYGEATWHVVFVAGGDGRTAERWLDANLTTVLDALRPWMHVDTVSPVDLGNNVAGVAFAGRKELP